MEETASRKSTRVRQKKTFGDDFLDPDEKVIPMNNNKKRKSASGSPAPSPVNESGLKRKGSEEVEKEGGETSKPTDIPTTSNTPSSILKHIADSVSDGILKEIKNEIREAEEAKNLEAMEIKKEIEKDYLKKVPTAQPMQWDKNGLPMKKWDKNGLPTKQRVEDPKPVTLFDEEDYSEDEEFDAEKEKELEEETSKTLAAIRMANVQKILEKRSTGKFVTPSQAKSQDAEINHYITTTKDISVLNHLPSTSLSRTGSKFVQLNNKTIAVPPALTTRGPWPPGQGPFAKLGLNVVKPGASEIQKDMHNMATVAPDCKLGTYLKLQMAKHKPNDPTIKYEPRQAPRRLRVPVMAPTHETSGPSTSGPDCKLGTYLRLQMAKHDPTSKYEPRKYEPRGPRRLGVNAPNQETSGPSTSGPPRAMAKVIYKRSVGATLPSPFSKSPRVVGPGPSGPPQGKQVAKILITRGPNGEIIPKGRYMIRTTGQPIPRSTVPVPSKTHSDSLVGIQPPAESQPDYIDVKQEEFETKEVKTEVPDEVKQEPLDDYEPPMKQPKEEPMMEEERQFRPPVGQSFAYSKKLITRLPVAIFKSRPPPPQPQQPLPPLPRGNSQIVIPKGARNTTLCEMLINGERNPFPHRIFLGAEEPMKDMGEDQYGRYSIRRVKFLNLDKFAWKRPVDTYQEDKPVVDDDVTVNTSFITNLLKRKREEDAKDVLIREAEQKLKKKKQDEYLRQKRALAQKLKMNKKQIWEYMQSEGFKKSIEPDEKATEFEKVLNRPNALAELPEFGDSLSHTNPELFKNLIWIFNMKHNMNQMLKNPEPTQLVEQKVFNDAPIADTVTPKIVIPVKKAEERPSHVLLGSPQSVEVVWNGIKANVPEVIQCHLCLDLMRLCMRKTKYRGEERSYPAYRCLRKGCQTFRSIKKQFQITLQASSSLGYQTQDPFYAKPKIGLNIDEKVKLLDRCEESLPDKPIKEEPNDYEDMPVLDKIEDMNKDLEVRKEPEEGKLVRKITLSKDIGCGTSAAEISKKDLEAEVDDEEEEEETVDFEYLTNNPMFEEEDPSEEDAVVSDYEENDQDESEIVPDYDFLEEEEEEEDAEKSEDD